MQKTVILDFIGVVADVNLIKFFSCLSAIEKVKALRIYIGTIKNKQVKQAFDNYQTGEFDYYDLYESLKQNCPKEYYVLPKLLNTLRCCIKVNENVLEQVYQLRCKGIKTVLISNSTPETESAMNEYNFSLAFDGVILSHHLGFKKPELNIYEYAIKKYNLNSGKVLMVDDTIKNLKTASSVGFDVVRITNSIFAYEFLKNLNNKLNNKNTNEKQKKE